MGCADERRRAFHHRRQRYRRHRLPVLEFPCVLLLLSISLVASQPTPTEPVEPAVPSLPEPPIIIHPTAQRDKEALLKIRESFLNHSARQPTALDRWSEDTDPCIDGWNFVHCDCQSVPVDLVGGEDLRDQYCEGVVPEEGNVSRVLFLWAQGMPDSDGKWEGPLVPEFGHLEKLLVLDLRENALVGEIPDTFRNLRRLRYLSFSGNSLNGTIPEYFSSLRNLIRVELNGNDFHGPIPEIGCRVNGTERVAKSKLTRMLVFENPGLCGHVPPCMEEVIKDVNETALYHARFNETDLTGGLCDGSPPNCGSEDCVMELPQYWTEENRITFNVTELKDEDSGIARYVVQLNQIGSTKDPDFNASAASVVTLDNEVLGDPIPRVNHTENGTFLRDWHIFEADLSERGVPLSNGGIYSVTVTAENMAGPRLNASIMGGPVTVDFTEPQIPRIFNTYPITPVGLSCTGSVLRPNQTDEGEQDIDGLIGVSWDGVLTDPETRIALVNLTVYLKPDPLNESARIHHFGPISINISATSRVLDRNKLGFEVDQTYQYELLVENGAGNQEIQLTNDFTLYKSESTFLRDLLYVVIAVCVFVIGAVTAASVVYCIPKIRQITRFDPDQHLKAFMYELLDMSPDDARTGSAPIMNQTDLAFVITDEEASTEQSHVNESAFRQLRDIHDMIIRDSYAEYSGYEIHTEGDSFQLAFSTVASAVRFCIDVQHKFLEFKWSPEIIRLPSCHVLKDARGKDIVFRGPRVRMAIHWAKKELVVNRVHSFTKHRVFEGPAFETTKELSNAAHGGQILLSHEAWLHFRNDFPSAGFPTIELLGSFALDTWPEAMPIYEVTQRVGKKLIRSFPTLRRLECVVPKGVGVNIIGPPTPDTKGMLTFVAAKLQTVTENPESLLMDMTFDLIAQNAQHFLGQIFQVDRKEGVVLLVFGSPTDAVRFAYATQMTLVLYAWPAEVTALCGATISGREHVPLFNGPRVGMAIHITHSFGVNMIQNENELGNRRADYAGHGVCFVHRLVDLAHGGQIILSGRTWTAVQNTLPSRSQTLNLGKHIIDDEYSQPVWLFELLPHDLKDRSFPPVKTKQKIELGYSDAPSIMNDIAIVFAKVEKPQVIRRFEERKDVADVSEKEMHDTLAVYYQSVSMFCSIVRHRLGAYNGYECKEPETGKFTLAFSELKDAILWACHVHAELLALEWPSRLLALDECSAVMRHGLRIHRGLRVKIGMAYGKVYIKSAMKTGRADYFGAIPNLAARVTSLARPGQVLIHSSSSILDVKDIMWIHHDAGLLLYDPPLKPQEDGASEVGVEISKLGMFLLRGFNELKMLYQAQPASVALPDRFGTNDVASMYSTESGPRMPTVSRFWSHLRFRSSLRYVPEPGSFLSYTTYPQGAPSSSYSHPGSIRPVSPVPAPHGLPTSELTAMPSRKNGGTDVLDTIHTQTSDGHEEDKTGTEPDPQFRMSPRSPIYFADGQQRLTQDANVSSSFQQSQPTQEDSTQEIELQQQTESLDKIDSVNSDECIVSFGTTESSMFKVVPPTRLGSSDEDTSPAEYGYQVASLYSNVTGARSNVPEFSFYSQKSDTADPN